MNLLTIDIGSYSIKIIESKINKKKIEILDFREVVLEAVRKQLNPEASLEAIQYSVIEEIFEQYREDYKIIFQLPLTFITTRYLVLPVNTKKKAIQMLPFQLEDSLYLNIDESHYLSNIEITKTNAHIQVFITQDRLFKTFHDKISQKNLAPDILVSEQSAIQNYLQTEKIEGSFAIIDIGHKTTKVYFINNKKIVANHISYFGGKNITKVISETYQIDGEEATIYKHDNAFLLTKNQYLEVNENQKEFAEIMQSAFTPFIRDFQMWELGFQSLSGKPVSKIFLTGGGSKIKNITNFLSQSLSVKVDYLNKTKYLSDRESISDAETPQFQNALIFTSINILKHSPLNFLTGKYVNLKAQEIPLYSIVFMATRTLYLAMLLSVGLVVNTYLMKAEIKKNKSTLVKSLKSPSLALKKNEKNLLRKKPERLIRILNKKKQIAKKSFSQMNMTTFSNATISLVTLSDLVKNPKDYVLKKYQALSGDIEAIFEASSKEKLNKLKKQIESSSLNNPKVKIKDLKLFVRFYE